MKKTAKEILKKKYYATCHISGFLTLSVDEMVELMESYASQTSISDEEIGEQIFDEITDWIYNVEDQAGNKLNVIDASDLKEIIPSIVAKLKAINHKPLGEWISVEDNTKTIR
jgi:hypothetical protein